MIQWFNLLAARVFRRLGFTHSAPGADFHRQELLTFANCGR